MLHLQRRYYVGGLHVSPCVVPRVVAALHDAGVLAGTPLRKHRGSSHELLIINHDIRTEIARSLPPCVRERRTPDGLLPFGLWCATGAKSVWTSKSSLHIIYLVEFLVYIIQCFAAGVRWWRSGQRVAARPGVWWPACGHQGRFKFRPRVAGPKLFVSAEGHLVSGAQVLLGHFGVGRKWPHKSLFHARYSHPRHRGSDGVWATPWRPHPSRGCSGWEIPALVIIIHEPNSICRWTSKSFFKKIQRCSEVKCEMVMKICMFSSKSISCPNHRHPWFLARIKPTTWTVIFSNHSWRHTNHEK